VFPGRTEECAWVCRRPLAPPLCNFCDQGNLCKLPFISHLASVEVVSQGASWVGVDRAQRTCPAIGSLRAWLVTSEYSGNLVLLYFVWVRAVSEQSRVVPGQR
jgi:hypothetical protein